MKASVVIAVITVAVLPLAPFFAATLGPGGRPSRPAPLPLARALAAPPRTSVAGAGVDHVIDLAPIVIVGRASPVGRAAGTAPPSPRPEPPPDLVRCTYWRPLEMGAGSVRECVHVPPGDRAASR